MGRCGRLALLWSNSSEIEIVNYSQFHIHAKVQDLYAITDGFITGFYGNLDSRKRQFSCELVPCINSETWQPWCVIGDFNEINTPEEKWDGNAQSVRLIENFVPALEDNGLSNLGWNG